MNGPVKAAVSECSCFKHDIESRRQGRVNTIELEGIWGVYFDRHDDLSRGDRGGFRGEVREDVARTNSCLVGLRSTGAAMAVVLAEKAERVCVGGGDDDQLVGCSSFCSLVKNLKGITHQVTTPTPETSLAILLGQG